MKHLAANEGRLVRATEAIASVGHCLRELLENSADAGSTIVTVQLTSNGLDRITVCDNGSGIPSTSLSLLCNEGATSKQLGSDVHGGRGKALDAISALSHVTVETADSDDGSGHRISFIADDKKMERCTRRKGTTVVVDTLFWPYAVRRRYWIEHRQENLREIQEVSIAFAIAGSYSLSVIVDSKVIVRAANQTRAQRIMTVLGRPTATGLVSGTCGMDEWSEGASVEYYTSSPTSASHGVFTLIVNNRPCVNKTLGKAIRREFRLCAGPKNPNVILFVEAPRRMFDFLPDSPLVAVTFAAEEKMRTVVCELLKKAWMEKSETPQLVRKERESPVMPPVEPTRAAPPVMKAVTPSTKCSATTESIKEAFMAAQQFSITTESTAATIDTASFERMSVVGQWNKSFMITKLGSDIFAIDQHAACEAANFEKLRKVKTGRKQKLINPMVISVAPEDQENAVIHMDKCREIGFEYVVRTGRIEVSCVPNDRAIATGIDDLRELLGLMGSTSSPMTQSSRSQLAYRACHSSVRAGDPMSHAQMRSLLKRMSESDYPWNCPHGRPTWCRIYNFDE